MLGLKYLKSGFYTDKSETITNAVHKYADAINNKNLTDEQLATIKSESEVVLGNVMVENGFREEGEDYIDLDKEFFDEMGELDNIKLGDFQKLMIRYYGLQDLKWTFAGTTSCLTPIIQKTMREKGLDYNDLLPIELKREKEKQENKKHKVSEDNGNSFYLYRDGSISGNYDKDKAKINFNALKDRSGFNWNSEFSPNNKIEKKGWSAGFNRNGVWEKVNTINNEVIYKTVKVAQEFLTEFSEDYSPLEDELVLLNIPLDMPEINEIENEMDESDTINFETILFDPQQHLKDGKIQKYFSVTGELYGIRELDKEKSLEGIKRSLKRQGIKQLSGIVISNNDKETIDYYKKKMGTFINKKTRIYTVNDNALKEKLGKLKKQIIERDVNENIISGFIKLASQGRSGDELYEGLVPGVVKSEYEVNLNIFKNKDDLNTFVKLPALQEELDEETVDYLQSVKVPDVNSREFSNAVQNILNNYQGVFKNSNMNKVDLLKTAHDIIVKKQSGQAKNIIISGEKKLGDFIKESILPPKKTDIPSFSRMFKKENDYYNLFQKEELDSWIKDNFKNKEVIEQVRNEMAKIFIPNNKVSKAIQNSFDQYESIAKSTGMKPAEIIKAVDDIINNKDTTGRFKNKKVYFDQNLEKLIKESTISNPNKVKMFKEDFYLAEKVKAAGRELDLLNNNDLNIFASSNFFNNAQINKNDSAEIIDYLKNVKIPANTSRDFTRGVINLLDNYPAKVAPTGVKPVDAVKSIEYAVKNDYNKIPGDLKSVLSQVNSNLFKTTGFKQNAQKANNELILDGFKKLENLDTFVKSAEFKQSGMNEEQLNNLVKQHMDAYQGIQNKYIKRLPINYKSKSLSVGDVNLDEMRGIDIPLQMRNHEIPNNIYNMGFVSSYEGNNIPAVHYFNEGKKLSPVVQNKIQMLTQYNSTVPAERQFNYSVMPLLSSQQDKQLPVISSARKIKTDNYNEMPIASPTTYVKGTVNKVVAQDNVDNISQNTMQHTQNFSNLTAEEQRIKRIEQNYYNDKKLLQQQSQQQQIQQQALRRSKTHSVGNAGGINNIENDDQNVVQELSDEIIAEFKKKMQEDL